ncbi:MAG: phosphate acyltransferase [Odoribacter sp.]
MALDVAIDKEAAEIKKINSVVAGEADCLIFPNLEVEEMYFIKQILNWDIPDRGRYWLGLRFPVYFLPGDKC